MENNNLLHRVDLLPNLGNHDVLHHDLGPLHIPGPNIVPTESHLEIPAKILDLQRISSIIIALTLHCSRSLRIEGHKSLQKEWRKPIQNADLERLGRWAVDSARRPENTRSGLRYVETVDLTVVELISLVGFSLSPNPHLPQAAQRSGVIRIRRSKDAMRFPQVSIESPCGSLAPP